MKIYVFANDIDTLKTVNQIGAIDTHYCSTAMKTLASKQIQFNLAKDANVNECAKEIANDLANENALLITSASYKDIAVLVAGYLNTIVITDVTKIDLNEGIVNNIVYGGGAVRTCKLDKNVNVVSLSSNYSYDDYEIELKDVNPSIKEINSTNVKVLEESYKQSSDVDLSKAKIIVAVGRGFAQKEDLDLAYKLADKLGAQIACSRPIAETEKWIDKSRYIGISANIISPDLYIAIGISGQVQHLVGCVNSKKIVVINKDDKAPFFESADLGIVGDLKEVLASM